LIETVSLVLGSLLAWHFGPTLQCLAAITFSGFLLALAVIDLEYLLLPDNLTQPLLWLGLLCNISGIFTSLDTAVAGAIIGYLILWGTFHIYKWFSGRDGIGYGDFKLLAAIGAWLGCFSIPAILVIASLCALIIRLLFFRTHSQHYFAFGPYLCFAGIVMLCWNTALMGYTS
jgi:leader peptidase (prepilin peptidase)/N-methyltransferase